MVIFFHLALFLLFQHLRISGLIIVQKYRVQNLDVDVIDRKLLIYFSLFKLFLKFFFCFAFAGIANIEESEIFVSMNHSVNLQYA